MGAPARRGEQAFGGARGGEAYPAHKISLEHLTKANFGMLYRPMMIFGLHPSAFAHVVISLIAIVSGFVVVVGLLAVKPLPAWTALFLLTTGATSMTGFIFFRFHHFMPSHGVGIISLVVLAVAVLARYACQLAGASRWIYVLSAVLALYLNVFVLIVQLFAKVPALNALAPQQTEAPFVHTQLAVMAVFIVLAIIAVIRFRPSRVARWAKWVDS